MRGKTIQLNKRMGEMGATTSETRRPQKHPVIRREGQGRSTETELYISVISTLLRLPEGFALGCVYAGCVLDNTAYYSESSSEHQNMEGTALFGLVLVIALGLNTAQGQSCCTPDQWEGLTSSTIGSSIRDGGKLTSIISYIYYDNTNQRSAAFSNITDSFGVQLSVETLVVYSAPNTGVLYKLDLKTKKCRVEKLSVPFPKFCIPDSAHKLADFTLGAANESLPVSFYDYKVPNKTVGASITVTRNQCIPVSELVTGEVKRVGFLQVVGFVDIKLGISQPSVFTVPSECQSHVLQFEKTPTKFLYLDSLASPYLHL